jgi:hypothetical protein
MERIAELAALFVPELRGQEPEAILTALTIAVEAELERVYVYHHGHEQRVVFSIPSRALALRSEESFPGWTNG